MNNSLVFFGNESLSSAKDYQLAPIFSSLLKSKYSIEALIIKNKPSRSRQATNFNIIDLSQKHNIPIIVTNNKQQLVEATQNLKSKIAILASFGLIVPTTVINKFPLGIVNVHPSLLPKYRGTTPIETAILNADQQTGISLIKLDQELDAGEIYLQEKITISNTLNKYDLTKKLGILASKLLLTNLNSLMQGNLPTSPQDHSLASYTLAIKSQPPHDLLTQTANYWQQHIKAFQGCPNNKFTINKINLEILEAKALIMTGQDPCFYNQKEGLIYLQTKRGYLVISKLKPSNSKAMTATDFVNGRFKTIKIIS